MKNQSSLSKLHKKSTIASLFGTTPENTMDQTGEDLPQRAISIKREQMSAPDLESQFENVVRKLSKAKNQYRSLVVDALIKTGSPKNVGQFNSNKLNKEIQNRLVSNSVNGRKFRTAMAYLLADKYKESFKNDSFFRTDSEPKVKVGGGLENPWTSNNWQSQFNYESSIDIEELGNDSNFNQTTSTENESGNTGSGQNWGSILQGGAQLVNSIGGILGMFQGGNQATQDENVMNQYDQGSNNYKPDEEKGKNRTGLIVAIVIGAIVIGGLIYWVTRSKGK